VEFKNPFVREAIENELLRREGMEQAAPQSWENRVTQVFREMALRYHPDRGGSTEAMQAVNDYYQRLKELTFNPSVN
jgi:hypothetical protein